MLIEVSDFKVEKGLFITLLQLNSIKANTKVDCNAQLFVCSSIATRFKRMGKSIVGCFLDYVL